MKKTKEHLEGCQDEPHAGIYIYTRYIFCVENSDVFVLFYFSNPHKRSGGVAVVGDRRTQRSLQLVDSRVGG